MHTRTTVAVNLQTQVGLLYKLYVKKCRSLFAQSNRFIYRLWLHSNCTSSIHAHTDQYTHRILAVTPYKQYAVMNNMQQ